MTLGSGWVKEEKPPVDVDAEVANSTYASIMSDSGEFFRGDLQRQCASLVGSEEKVTKKYQILMDLIERASNFISPHVVCKDGCHHCCHMAVSMTGFEADRIGRFIGKTPEQANFDFEALGITGVEGFQTMMIDSYMGVDCPFLVDNRCSIYEVRPIACRVYFNLSGNASRCDLTIGKQDVPNFDFGIVYATQVMMFQQYEFEDIRQFYPDVSEWTKKYRLTNSVNLVE